MQSWQKIPASHPCDIAGFHNHMSMMHLIFDNPYPPTIISSKYHDKLYTATSTAFSMVLHGNTGYRDTADRSAKRSPEADRIENPDTGILSRKECHESGRSGACWPVEHATVLKMCIWRSVYTCRRSAKQVDRDRRQNAHGPDLHPAGGDRQ